MFALTIALALAAQAAPQPAGSDDIVVTGERLTREAARRYVNDISRPVNDQLPAFRNPVCPTVIGMPEENAAVIVERVKKVAKYVGVKVGKPGCATNFRIIVVEDAQAFVSELHRQKPVFFAGMEKSEIDRLMKDQRPALAWSAVQTQNEDGQVYADYSSGKGQFDRAHGNRVSASGVPTDSESEGAAADVGRATPGGKTQRNMSASIIKSSTQQAILDSYVVIDSAAANGKTLMQVADYAVMRALAAAQPPAEATGVDTILTLFNDGGETPPSLRAPDVAYLKALYSASPTMGKMQQLNRLSKAVLETSPEEPAGSK
ncbi:hypothetical protein E2493_20860 [Sphingomonas parva]|uniref:DUF2927 domain-containing protein n=2 Tax=Sphingomonas parva TaxID=2555898 RepID=A0A4Y8ZK45_9SPHN|nr:hypothetical protein [Sphingomonas parva]TFI56304.1 hypothetical protein E2493_20860 [Sphingomonas parva]